jgi:hypothetical protein
MTWKCHKLNWSEEWNPSKLLFLPAWLHRRYAYIHFLPHQSKKTLNGFDSIDLCSVLIQEQKEMIARLQAERICLVSVASEGISSLSSQLKACRFISDSIADRLKVRQR